MKLDDCIRLFTQHYKGLQLVQAWGESSLFYNPETFLPRGTYCFTFKEKDGENDSSSMLNREGIDFRLNFKVKSTTYLRLFTEPRLPKRPPKGGIILPESGQSYDPTVLNQLIPHPVYGWMGWVSIINPDEVKIQDLLTTGLLDEAYEDAKKRYLQNPAVRVRQKKRSISPDEVPSSSSSSAVVADIQQSPRKRRHGPPRK